MIAYAVNRETKEHRRADWIWQQMRYGADWKIVEADDDGWIPWEGVECPLPSGQRVEVRYLNGACRKGFAGNWSPRWWSAPGDITGPDDITAYRPILDEPSEPGTAEWSGDGLPPAGCECECASVCDTGDDDESATWELAKVIGHDGPAAVVAIDGGGYAGSACCADFRPIRSEEDLAVEAMLEVIHGDGHLSETGARALYRAGYRKGE